MPSSGSTRFTVWAALAGNVLVALTKFVAAFASCSASMLSEAIHSLVDTGNEVLLLYGMKRSQRSADALHPLGYGRELYFWSFIVALLLFALGACVSAWEGVERLIAPSPIERADLVYVVLGLSALFEGTSWWVSLRAFRRAKGGIGWWDAIRRSKDPPAFLVLFEDSAALIGIAIAAAGTFASDRWGWTRADGVASILIGVVLASTATILARETMDLLIGERADPAIARSIVALAAAEPGVVAADGVLTVQLAPDEIVVALGIEFDDALRAPEIEACIERIEARVRDAHAAVTTLFVKPQASSARSPTGSDTPLDL